MIPSGQSNPVCFGTSVRHELLCSPVDVDIIFHFGYMDGYLFNHIAIFTMIIILHV